MKSQIFLMSNHNRNVLCNSTLKMTPFEKNPWNNRCLNKSIITQTISFKKINLILILQVVLVVVELWKLLNEFSKQLWITVCSYPSDCGKAVGKS